MNHGVIYQPVLSPFAMCSESSINPGKMTMVSVIMALTTRPWLVSVKRFTSNGKKPVLRRENVVLNGTQRS